MGNSFVCHYHEIILKGKNRQFFEGKLKRNIRLALKDLPVREVRRHSGRILIDMEEGAPAEEVSERLRRVFGIAVCARIRRCPLDLEEIKQCLWQEVQNRDFQTFKIQARRAQKNYPLNSQQLNERLGAFLVEKTGRKVRLKDPDLTCHVDLVGKEALVYFDKIRGAGGLPVSSSGKVVALLSGGIDSPVAAFKMMKRGCRVIFVHFHSFPHTTPESLEKVRQIAALLSRYQYRSKLHMIPFAELQRQVVAFTPPDSRIILYRRLMLRIAEKVALQERAQGLVTGESIGQVASQTLPNIRVISRVARLPVLRPLIGDDKEEIIEVARDIGTYPVSILPDVDCCSLFVPRHPVTRARAGVIEASEKILDVEQMVDKALEEREIETFTFPETPQLKPA